MIILLCGAGSALAAATSDDDLYAGADARIEKHRKAPATVSVVDASGKPVAGAEVVVEQVQHAFLFGSNIFKWGRFPDEALETAYRQRFAELLNYATLPRRAGTRADRAGRPLVPGAGHRHQGAPARVERRRPAVAARRP
jgi:hypothetical protein